MPLFHVQDNERPAYVIAKDYGEACSKWKMAIAKENDIDPQEIIDEPMGIAYLSDDTDLIVENDWKEK